MARKWQIELTRTVKAIWKYLLSYRKKDWELSDYPIEVRWQKGDSPLRNERWKEHVFWASIIRWHVIGGSGDSSAEAMAELEKNFAAVRVRRSEEGKGLPRPGTSVPIEFAPQNRVDAHPELLDDFVRRVLQLDWALITDESCLWHFHTDDSNDLYVGRIRAVYGVNVADIESGNIAEILNRIAASVENPSH